MRPLELARTYMEIFFSGGDPDTLRPLFADDLRFTGPFYAYDSAEAYIDALKKDPPEDVHYELIKAFEDEASACLVYHFSKPGLRTPMAQLFEVTDGVIQRIILVFDTGAFR